MKKLISKLSGRLVSLLVPAFLVASFLAPTGALAKKEMSLGGGGTGDGSEGDPLDTNDVGGGGGGGSDIHNDSTTTRFFDLLGFSSSRLRVLVVPEYLGGIVILRIIVVDNTDLGLLDLGVGDYNAP
ncbi:MAG: hypothetical protein ABFS42_08295 [Candidatus Krumholzibacteriota bacterium]